MDESREISRIHSLFTEVKYLMIVWFLTSILMLFFKLYLIYKKMRRIHQAGYRADADMPY